MSEQQANELAESIKQQFPHVETIVLQSVDMRNAPNNWFVGVQRRAPFDAGISLHIHNRQEWIEAVEAKYVLSN